MQTETSRWVQTIFKQKFEIKKIYFDIMCLSCLDNGLLILVY